MSSRRPNSVADRHALVMTIWLPSGPIATALYHYGLGAGSAPSILAAFGVVAAAFVGHLIVNAVYATDFTDRELALGLVLYSVALAIYGISALFDRDLARTNALPTTMGFLALFVGFVLYMVTRLGARRAFQAFDVVRTFKASSRDEGGRAHR